VRENDERQLCARDRAILHADEAIVDGHGHVAEIYVFRLRPAWIPDRARQIRAMLEKLNTCGVAGRSQATENDNASPKCRSQRSPP
jgi:hypothetical protein